MANEECIDCCMKRKVIYGHPEMTVREAALLMAEHNVGTLPVVDEASVLVGVTTIGPQLDAQARRLHQAGKALPAYLLDCVGVIALGQAGQALRRMAEKRAAKRGWGVGPSLGPGTLAGWDLQEQSVLCAGLDLDAIGVHLNESNVLVPFKSASGLVGLGPDYLSRKVGSVCRFCMLSKSCWRAEHVGG